MNFYDATTVKSTINRHVLVLNSIYFYPRKSIWIAWFMCCVTHTRLTMTVGVTFWREFGWSLESKKSKKIVKFDAQRQFLVRCRVINYSLQSVICHFDILFTGVLCDKKRCVMCVILTHFPNVMSTVCLVLMFTIISFRELRTFFHVRKKSFTFFPPTQMWH